MPYDLTPTEIMNHEPTYREMLLEMQAALDLDYIPAYYRQAATEMMSEARIINTPEFTQACWERYVEMVNDVYETEGEYVY